MGPLMTSEQKNELLKTLHQVGEQQNILQGKVSKAIELLQHIPEGPSVETASWNPFSSLVDEIVNDAHAFAEGVSKVVQAAGALAGDVG